MKYGNIIIEKKEYTVLKEIIAMARNKTDDTYKASLDKFLNELKDAKVLPEAKLPADVVRFNSVVTILDPYRNIRSYEIVKPEKSSVRDNRISVLAPMGLALFGYAIDDDIMWRFPSGVQAIKILKVEHATTTKEITT